MSVEWMTCPVCTEIFNDHQPDIFYCDCDEVFCSSECATEGKYVLVEEDTTCGYCTGAIATDTALLTFALKELGQTREQLLENWKETK